MQNETFRVCEQTGYFVRSALEKTAAARNGCLSCWNSDGQLAADKRQGSPRFCFPTSSGLRLIGKEQRKQQRTNQK